MYTKKAVILIFLFMFTLSACTSPPTPDLTAEESIGSPTETATAPAATPSPTPTSSGAESSAVPVNIHAVHMLNAGSGWAVGSISTAGSPQAAEEPASDERILFTNDGGSTWIDVSPPEVSPQGSSLQADAAFIDLQHAWVVYTGSTMVWSTIDAGSTWTAAPALPSGMLGSRFHALDNRNGWLLRSLEAGMSQVWETLFHTSSGGETWTKLIDPYEQNNFARFSKTGWDFFDSQNGWMTHNSQGVSASLFFQRTTDGGETWQNIELPPPADKPDLFEQALCYTHSPKLFSPASGLVALNCKTTDPETNFPYLYQTSDGGNTWSVFSYPGGDLFYLPDNTIIAAGVTITKSVDGGEHWELLDDLEWDAQYNIVSPEILFATFEHDGTHFFCKTMDGCKNWTCLEPVLLDYAGTAASEEVEPVSESFTSEFAYLSYRANPENYDTNDLYLASLDDTEPTRLTDSGSLINSFSWDPTGTMIVLSSDLDGDQELYLMPLDTSSWQQLTNNSSSDMLPSFSPDGRQIAYVTGERGSEKVHLLDLSLQASRFLAPGTTPAWSSDGSRLLVFREEDGVYEIDIESDQEIRLIDSSENGIDSYPSYSLSGYLLLTASNRHSPGDYLVEAPFLFKADGSLMGRLGTVWGSPPYAWLPDGSGLLVTSDFLMMSELHLLDMNGALLDLPLIDPSGWFPRFRPGY
ncbi:MAG: PD40 domain-containing protein [Anaerolineales bacterium]|nr:PD40 domain-containing protein [Anaerolineales bacterium]